MSLLPLPALAVPALAVPLGLALAGSLLASPSAAAPAPRETLGRTIVAVHGTQAEGFTVRHHDGTLENPPTDSEARAECNEYDTRVARVRCRVGVRTSYHYLGELKRSLRYARS